MRAKLEIAMSGAKPWSFAPGTLRGCPVSPPRSTNRASKTQGVLRNASAKRAAEGAFQIFKEHLHPTVLDGGQMNISDCVAEFYSKGFGILALWFWSQDL
jgi:hypothetical protein